MINPHLVTTDWQLIATESRVVDTLFKKDELAESVAQEISFEAGIDMSRAKALVQSVIDKIVQFITATADRVQKFVTGAHYKTMGNRAKSVENYMKHKFSSTAKYNGSETFRKIYAYDETFKRGFDNALENLNYYLDKPFEDMDDFWHTFRHNPIPISVAHDISLRAKVEGIMNPGQLEKFINVINKVLLDAKSYDFTNFQDPDFKFRNIDELRFELGDHNLFDNNEEEFRAVSDLMRGMYVNPAAKIKDSIQIYDTSKNTQYIYLGMKYIPECLQSLRAAAKHVKSIETKFRGVSNVSSEADKDAVARMQAYVNMIGAVSGYIGNVSALIARIDGYNSAVMTVMRYMNPDWLNKHIKDRGLLGGGAAEVDQQAYDLLMNESGVLELALEDAGLTSVRDEMRKYSDDYIAASALESRIQAYGVCIKDAAALESMSPDCFKGQQITDLFDFRPSHRNAEVALEATGLIKSVMISALVTMIIKYLNQLIDYIKVRLSRQRIERARQAMERFKDNLKRKVQPTDNYHQSNQDIMAGIQKMNGNDKSGQAPSGHSHNSAVKKDPVIEKATGAEVDITGRRALYKNVLVPALGIDDNAAAGMASCTDVNDFLRFLSSTNVQGPALFSNDPIGNAQKLAWVANTVITETHRISKSMSSVKNQIDGFIAGSISSPHFITEANGAFQNYLNDFNTQDSGKLARDTRDAVRVQKRRVNLSNSPLFRDPKVIQDTFAKLGDFKDDKATSTLSAFARELESLSKQAQASLDRFMKTETDETRKATVEKAVKKYMSDLRELAEAIGTIVDTISSAYSYIETVANAVNTFMKG